MSAALLMCLLSTTANIHIYIDNHEHKGDSVGRLIMITIGKYNYITYLLSPQQYSATTQLPLATLCETGAAATHQGSDVRVLVIARGQSRGRLVFGVLPSVGGGLCGYLRDV